MGSNPVLMAGKNVINKASDLFRVLLLGIEKKLGVFLDYISDKIYMLMAIVRDYLQSGLQIFSQVLEPWRIQILFAGAFFSLLLLIVWLVAFVRHMKKFALLWQKERSSKDKPAFLEAMSRWLFELVCNILDILWMLLEPHPGLYNRDSIRYNANKFAQKLKRLGIFGQKPGSRSKLRLGLLALMDEGRGEALRDLPADLLEAVNSTDPGLLVWPEAWRKMLLTVLDRHKAGNYSSLFITGSSGSGKSAVLDWLKNHAGMPVFHFSPGSRDEAALMMEKITGKDYAEPSVLVIDNLEYFFIRKPGGLRQLEELLLFNDGKRDVLKVFAAGTVFFNFCSAILPLADLFPFHLDLDKPGARQLADVFDQKLLAAGYKYKVIPDSLTYKQLLSLKKRHAISEEDAPLWLKERFFDTLIGKGGSGFHFVNHYFLKAIGGIRNKVISLRISPPELFDLSFVANWPLESLFLLQAIYIHRSMSLDEAAGVLRMPTAGIAMDMARARERSLLALNESGQYGINPMVHRVLMEELLKKKLLITG